jgi:hypothetical protein
MIKLTIEPNDAGRIHRDRATTTPTRRSDGPTYGLCEANAPTTSSVRCARGDRGTRRSLPMPPATTPSSRLPAMPWPASVVGRRRLSLRLCIEGDDVPGVTVGPVADE